MHRPACAPPACLQPRFLSHTHHRAEQQLLAPCNLPSPLLLRPFFCYSHLVSKIRVKPCTNGQPTCAPPGSAFAPTAPARPALDAVLSASDIQAAQDMVREGRCTRTFKFGRRRGQW